MMVDTPPNFAPARFVITGPTGWIGSALLAMLHDVGDPDGLIAGESVRLFGSCASTVSISDQVTLPISPLSEICGKDVEGAHLIHLSYLTKDKIEAIGSEQFRATNRQIDDAVLNAVTQHKPASIFVASSGAAQQAEIGIDREPYGLAKLEQEARFLQFAQSEKIPIICGRIFNIAGPHINKLEAYAISNFALQALRNGKIRVNAQNPVFRSYLHIHDLCRIILRAARERIDRPKPIDLCGTQILEMQEIAELVALAMEQKTFVERARLSSSKPSRYFGNSENYQSLAKQLKVTSQEVQIQIQDTVNWINASSENLTKPLEEHAS